MRIVKYTDGEKRFFGSALWADQKLLVAGIWSSNRAYLWLAECKLDAWTKNLQRRYAAWGRLKQCIGATVPRKQPQQAIDEDISTWAQQRTSFGPPQSADAAIAQLKQKFAYTGGGLLDFTRKIYFSTQQPLALVLVMPQSFSESAHKAFGSGVIFGQACRLCRLFVVKVFASQLAASGLVASQIRVSAPFRGAGKQLAGEADKRREGRPGCFGQSRSAQSQGGS